MNDSAPLISVLMPVYNAASYVQEAIVSILEQDFTDFELLIFNDGSTDNTREVISAINDKRIRFFDSEQNVGYVTHLNQGLDLARGTYIARMDADDIALPNRFMQQVLLLESNPAIGLCGTSYDTFGAQNIIINVPTNDAEIREYLLANSPMGHPTVMFRLSVMKQHNLCYDKSFMPAEDYKLWYDFSKISRISNLPDVLLHYRVHSHQISMHLNSMQRLNANRVRLLQLSDKGFQLNEYEQSLYCDVICNSFSSQSVQTLKEVLKLMWKIYHQNCQLKAYEKDWFDRLFVKAWRELVNKIYEYSPLYILPIVFYRKPMIEPFGPLVKIKILLKSLLFWKV